MATVRTFYLPHYPQYPIYISMFKDATNAEFLKSQLLEANAEFDYAFLDASMILSTPHILTPLSLVLSFLLSTPPRLKTRTPHAELIFRLHPNNNIAESFKRFGISETTTSIIAVKIMGLQKSRGEERDQGEGIKRDEEEEFQSVKKFLEKEVKGVNVDVGPNGEEIGMFADINKIKKIYKLNNASNTKKSKSSEAAVNGNGHGAGGAGEDEKKWMEAVILGMMTLKGS